MTIILAILGAIFGAVAGGIIGFFGIIALGYATGADSQQGAIEMGAAVTGLPLGAIIGAILCAVLVVRMRRRPPPAAAATDAGADTGAATTDAPQPAMDTSQPPPRPGIGAQGWIALGLVATLAAAGWTWLNWTGDPPLFRGASKPVLQIEIRLPAADPDIDAAIARGTDLRNEEVYHGVEGRLRKTVDGDYAVLSGTHRIAYKTGDRSVELWLGQERLLIFNLDLPSKPPEQDAFTDWRPVDEIRPHFYGDPVAAPDSGHDIFIRTRVVWARP